MTNSIKLEIGNFGGINKSKIEIAPLMVFVGDRDDYTFKYMNLLYGLFTYLRSYRCCEIISNKIKKDQLFDYIKDHLNEKIIIDKDLRKMLISYMNKVLSIISDDVVYHTFNNFDFGFKLFGKIKITDVIDNEHKTFKTIVSDNFNLLHVSDRNKFYYTMLFPDINETNIQIYMPVLDTKYLAKACFVLAYHYIMDTDVFKELYTIKSNQSIYYPIERDGLELVNRYVKPEIFNKERPCIKNYISLLNYYIDLENIFLEGNLPYPNFINTKMIAIEEPFKNFTQTENIVKNLIRLVNKYQIYVWLTTNNTDSLYNFNIEMMLSKNKDKEALMKEYELDDYDLIDNSKFKVYEIKEGNIIKSKYNEYGYKVENVNKVIANFNTRYMAVQPDIDG